MGFFLSLAALTSPSLMYSKPYGQQLIQSWSKHFDPCEKDRLKLYRKRWSEYRLL